jgi:AraC family transcriptional regulator, transcriptional activator of pobA
MQEIKGPSGKTKHHSRLDIIVNENCKLYIPQEILEKLLKPHRLAHYCFVFLEQSTETYKLDLEDITISDGQMIFGLPNQIFCNPPRGGHNPNYKAAFDENLLALLPNSFPFLLNPLNTNIITFTPDAKQRVKSVFSHLFQLLHTEDPADTAVILAYMNTLLTEFNSAYFEHGIQGNLSNPKLSKYIAFKLAVETNLSDQLDVHSIARQLSMTPSSLYGIVKEFSGISPKEWMTGRLMLEAKRKLQFSKLSVKELAYQLGFNDPNYFSRLFKKATGKSVSAFIADHHDLSSN